MEYPSDLKDGEWELIESYFERPDPRGKKPLYNRREMINAIFYVVKGGIQWRMMPKEYPPWKTVYSYFRRLCLRGVWETILDILNEQHRQKKGRDAKPSYGIVDSQSVKNQFGGDERGIDGGKKIKGRKRHIAVDILWNLLHIKVHAADIHDTISGCEVFKTASKKYANIKAFSADEGYRGTSASYVENELNLKMCISKKIKDTFAILPKRWIVERTFAWLGNFRRLAKDFEIITRHAENMVRIAMIRLTLKWCV